MVKMPPVSFETIVYMITNAKGPAEQIKKYLNLIESIERRQALALKFKLSDVVIEVEKKKKFEIN